jgi:hypothetical protein
MAYDSDMKKEQINRLYEELVLNREAYEDGLKKYPIEKVSTFIDELGIFKEPMSEILEMSQESYAQEYSDKRFSFDFSNRKVSELMDRIIISHTDGSVRNQVLELAYLHEDPFESGQYNVKTDLNIVQYGLAVLAGLSNVTSAETLASIVSPDAAVSIMLALKSIKETGRG